MARLAVSPCFLGRSVARAEAFAIERAVVEAFLVARLAVSIEYTFWKSEKVLMFDFQPLLRGEQQTSILRRDPRCLDHRAAARLCGERPNRGAPAPKPTACSAPCSHQRQVTRLAC